MKLPKPILIALGIIILIIIVVVSVFVSPSTPLPQQSPSPLPHPQIEPKTKSVPLTTNINAIIPDLPPTLPIYTLDPQPLLKNQAVQIAQNLGFSSPPLEVTDVADGQVYLWQQNTTTLRIVPNLHLIDYKTGTIPPLSPQNFASNLQLITLAQTFLDTNQLVDVNQLTNPQVKYFLVSEESFDEVNPQQANIARVEFNLKLTDYQIVSDNSDLVSVGVQISSNNQIVAALIDGLPQISNQTSYSTKTKQEIISALPQAKLRSLDNGNILLVPSQPPPISTLTITQITLAYLQENRPNQTILQPILSLTATAQLETGQTVPALLYLPALTDKSFQPNPTTSP